MASTRIWAPAKIPFAQCRFQASWNAVIRMEGMHAANSEADRFFIFQRYTHAWQLGTGLKVSLAPGKYRVTGEEKLNGVLFFRLLEGYRIDAREFRSAASKMTDE